MGVYVPLPRNSLWQKPRSIVRIQKSRLTADRDWTTSTTTGTALVDWMSGAKSATIKSHITHYPWGSWRPCLPYSRRGTLVTLMGNTEKYADTVDLPKATSIWQSFGYPLSAPTEPTVLIRTGAANTGGLIDGGLPVLNSNTANRLISECMVKVADRKVNYGESLAEGVKTLNHLAKTSSTVLRAYRYARRGNWSGFARSLGLSKRNAWTGKTASERWLESQYAWLPLLSDIYATHQVLTKGLRDPNRKIISSVRQITESSEYSFDSIYGKFTGPVRVIHRCKLWYRMNQSTIDSLAQLGLINPLEVAWAVVPYSFVLDWFIPVGTLLEAYSGTMGLTFIDGCISSRGEFSATCRHIRSPSTNAPLFINGDFVWKVEHLGFTRQRAIAVPLPYVKSPFSTKHVISALALIRQLSR